MKKLLLLAVTAFFITGCQKIIEGEKAGEFLTEVVPLTDFNSEYDDYNSSLAENKYGDAHLIFSSRRDRKDVFNLVYFPARFSYDTSLTLRSSGSGTAGYESAYALSVGMAREANGNFNVLGPKVISLKLDLISDGASSDTYLFYADDSEGNLEIKYASSNDKGVVTKPVKFDLLNSPADDAYPSFSFLGDKIYFCSNRGGNFDIYEVSIPRKPNERVSVESLTHPQNFTLTKVEELSGPYDDKCPYLYENTMVFTSNRPGGKGGYDIYVSKLVNGKWSVPENAGSRINTAYNEYRPILPALSNFNYNLAIFSSDRPGGKGGYDLYMTGLDSRY